MKKRRTETSKVALMGVLVFCGVSMLAIIAGWLAGREEAPVLLATVSGLAVMVVRYYMKKAQAENIIKIQRTNQYTDAQIAKLLDQCERGTK